MDIYTATSNLLHAILGGDVDVIDETSRDILDWYNNGGFKLTRAELLVLTEGVRS